MPENGGDKEERGRVLVVGGAPQMPGAVILAATAALRAGAGKLQIATCASVAPHVATAVPEAYVVALREGKSGCVTASAEGEIFEHAAHVQALVIGPGMTGERAIAQWLPRLVRRLGETDVTLVVDAAALACLARDRAALHPMRGRAVITPHAGEMAMILGADRMAITARAEETARAAASEMRAVVALKGATTYIAPPRGSVFRNDAGNVGLATSGSGDTLSGVIAGLAARGADALQAAVWGVHAHACAGDRLARTMAPLGYLARELLAEVPVVLASLDPRAHRRS
jgi:hydroxyethylthiazole kinase-like uncharacterized protein yjeF